MRWLPCLLCLALAGCMTDSARDVVPSSSAQAPASAGKPAEAKKDEWWKQGGVTREKVSAMCWMKYEKGRNDIAIDKRADLVNRCVADTLKANPPAAPAISIVR